MWEGVKDFRHVSEVSKNKKTENVVGDPQKSQWVRTGTCNGLEAILLLLESSCHGYPPLRPYLLGPHIYVAMVSSQRLPECVGQGDPFGLRLSKAVQEQRDGHVIDKAHG